MFKLKSILGYCLIFMIATSCQKSPNPEKKLDKNINTNHKIESKRMTKFELKPFTTIEGIGAASGLVFFENKLFIIGDNSGFLYEYDLKSQDLKSFPLIKNAQNLTPKKIKADFEAIALHDGNLQIFASGSTKKRTKQISFSLGHQIIKESSLKKLYQKFKEKADLTDKDLNIEGVVYSDNKQYFFQRGNGENSKNGIFTVFENDIQFTPISLPFILGIESGFTDATVFEDKCYFLATAENTNSTYHDGEILGSLFGCMDLVTFKVEYSQQIAMSEKMEGITVFKNDEKILTFLLCEDNDLQELKSNIYELKIYK